ncbi:hypothetical protein HGP16_23465 [Rhizobium sp. P40RR-XXII]|uniref:hypothetical protein n=1 Tax=unclassified Rhizobium TaxID=2613769 RepID=UPI0014565BDC|nr:MULTISPECIES: hypothetical protein [unclassified Rhizobium]NLR87993.1 hypothetical protein [Rhizobium sp. P28RR-XV]NLS19502.1 hypothetical protein [Rhizobium sp. P40RR-XXII]
MPPTAKGSDAARTTREFHDERRSEILLIRTAWDNDEMRAFPLHLPAVVILPVLPMSVRIVPLLRIKAKKIPIVQPILTFAYKNIGEHKLLHIFQIDNRKQK